MRAKTAVRGGRKSSTSTSSPPSSRFQLGDLVICRYSTYPYWPATIDQTHQARYKGAHVMKRRTRRGDKVLAYWCTFSNEDTGGWVRHDRITRYHPDIVAKIRLDEADDFFEDQAEALKVAQRAYAALPPAGRPPKPPARLPKDFSANVAVNSDDEDMLQSDGDEGDGDDDDDDDDDDVEDDGGDEDAKEKTPQKPSNSRTRRRGTGRSSTKRNGASGNAPSAPAAHESDDEMDLGDDSDDDPKDVDGENDNSEKGETKPASRKPAKRARLPTMAQPSRRATTPSSEKSKPSAGRATRTSVTPKKEPRRVSTKRKPPGPSATPRERKRTKSSSQNSIPPASSKPNTSQGEADGNVIEIPVPKEDPSSHAPPKVKKVLHPESKQSQSDESSDSEQDDASSPQKKSLPKSATNDSPGSSKKQSTARKPADTAKETARGSGSKALDADSKSQEKSSSSSAAKSDSSSIVDDPIQAVSKPKKENDSLGREMPLPNSLKEKDESSLVKDESMSMPPQKSGKLDIIVGVDHCETPSGGPSRGQVVRPGKDVPSDSKMLESDSEKQEKAGVDKDGDSDVKEAADSTLKIDIVEGAKKEEESGEIEVKIVEQVPNPEAATSSKGQGGGESSRLENVKKNKEDTDVSNDVKSTKGSLREDSEQNKERAVSRGKVLRETGIPASPSSTDPTAPKRVSGVTSDKEPTAIAKDKSSVTSNKELPSKPNDNEIATTDSKAADSPSRKPSKDSEFVKIEIESKPNEDAQFSDLPPVKILEPPSKVDSAKKSDHKLPATETTDSGRSEATHQLKRTDQHKVVSNKASEAAPNTENSSYEGIGKAEKAMAGIKASIPPKSKSTAENDSTKAVDVGRKGDNDKGKMVEDIRTTSGAENPLTASSHTNRPTTGVKQPILVKITSSKASLSAGEENNAALAATSIPKGREEDAIQGPSKSEKVKSSDESEKIAKMSENSAIQAGIAGDGVQEDDIQESQGDIGSTDVKRQASNDTTEVDVMLETSANTLEGLKGQLERARLTIGKLRSKLKALDEIHEGKNGETISLATFVMPIAPDNLKLDLPSPDLYMTDPVDANRFVEVVQHIRKTFDNFKTRVKAAEHARNELQTQAVELRKRYEEKCESVLKAEEEAVMEERELIDILKKLLVYKANAAELKKHKAGNLVRSIGKTCKQMPAVANICNEIYVTWRSHFLRHLVSSTDKAKGGEQESDGMGLQRKDESEKPGVEKNAGTSTVVKGEIKLTAVKEDKSEGVRVEKVIRDEKMEERSEGGDAGDDDNKVDKEGGDVDMVDAEEDNGDDADMDDDDSGDNSPSLSEKRDVYGDDYYRE